MGLSVVGAVEEGDDLAAHAVVVRSEETAADAVRDAVFRRPCDRIGIVAIGGNVGKNRRAHVRFRLQRPEQDQRLLGLSYGNILLSASALFLLAVPARAWYNHFS